MKHEKTKEYLLSKANKYDGSEATIEDRIINYSNHDSLDRHMPRTSKKQFVAVCLLSPFIALGAWLWLIILACKES
jgi:hypothetical protein